MGGFGNDREAQRVVECVCILLLCSVGTLAQMEIGVCSSELYPTIDRVSLFEGGMENARPLNGEMLERLDSGAELFGCICRKDLSAEDIAAYLSKANPYFQPDESDCLTNCQVAEALFGYPEGSDSFLTTIFNTTGRVFSYAIIDETITVERPNLRFNMAFEHDFISPFQFDVTMRVGGRNGPIVTLFNGFLSGLLTPTDCGTTKWARFTVPLKGILNAPEFLALNASLDRSVITIFANLEAGSFAGIDNIELVGPPLTNQSEIDLLQVQTVQTALPDVEISFLGESALDAFVSLFIVFAFAFYLVATVVVLWKQEPREECVNIMTRVWAVLSLILSVYALFEYFDFLQDLNELDALSQTITQEVQSIIRSTGFDSRQLPVITNGKAVYGAFLLPLPRFDRDVLERVFTFQDGLVPECVQSRITGQQCAATVDEFFDMLNTSTMQTVLTPAAEALIIEGTVFTSQDHFLDALLASLLGDLVVGGILLFVSWRMDRGSAECMRVQRGLEGFITIFNFGIIIFLLFIAINEPIRFAAQVNLVDAESGVGLHVIPKADLLQTSATGSFALDSKGLGISERCIPLGQTVETSQVGIFELYRIGLFQTITRELSPGTVGTDLETCDWGNLSSVALPDDSACSSLDCSNGVISFVVEEAVKPLFNFVQTRIILGVILVDVFISVIDVLVLLQVFFAAKDESGTLLAGDK